MGNREETLRRLLLKRRQHTKHSIDLCCSQVANCYLGQAGRMGIIANRKAYQKSLAEGSRLLDAIGDVYLSPEVTAA